MHTTLIDARTLHTNIHKPEWVIFDCRFSLKDTELGRSNFEKGHLPTAQYLHLDEDLSGPIIPGTTGRHPLPDPTLFAKLLGTRGVSNTTQVVAYDDMSGAIASRLWWMLKWLGHDAVAVFDGGIQAWTNEGFALTADVTSPMPQTFVPHVRESLSVEVGDIESRIQSDAPNLIDARAHERYLGHVEPIDPVAGHIPGARSLPFKENLNTDGAFLDQTSLRTRFAARSEQSPTPIVYCGSGVTACHNILAIVHAGLPMPLLYPGSWSHWITDSKRRVETDSD